MKSFSQKTDHTPPSRPPELPPQPSLTPPDAAAAASRSALHRDQVPIIGQGHAAERGCRGLKRLSESTQPYRKNVAGARGLGAASGPPPTHTVGGQNAQTSRS